MISFKDFASFNKYINIAQPLDNDIDVGYYNPPAMRLQSEPVMVDFYRISFKKNFVDKTKPDAKLVNAVFFNSPEMVGGWDIEPSYKGMYVQLSKQIIQDNRFLFRNHLDYGLHEPLLLTDEEIQEVETIFALMSKYYQPRGRNRNVLLSYVNVLVSLIETFYERQFSMHPKQYNRIVTEFQQGLKDYYNQPVSQIPSVQYFADKLGLSANYLGDIIKHFTQRSAIENIHAFVIAKAKELLENRQEMNSTQVAYELGFEYPNYFSKFFKKQVNLTPKQYRLKAVRN